jgi:hypothetical protein
MAATPSRPAWFGHTGVQVLAGLALAYNLVQIVLHLVDTDWAGAFLSFAWCVAFGYLLSESWKVRKEQQATADGDAPSEPTD